MSIDIDQEEEAFFCHSTTILLPCPLHPRPSTLFPRPSTEEEERERRVAAKQSQCAALVCSGQLCSGQPFVLRRREK